ncbi:PREDICTED: uncharacterized protein LOC108368339 [Rhagoletis zephyria]|uniref:uncharacterized protein LOC108368339 n=1 Tax=Rhagoletis zephyria TaxID=28612 RepID=UPI00081171E1|nr:PREDICTED: uncharacterized protein LOC108368339 [Rhagoletis zephyria]XP_036337787.1 uncharacterized protein LOC118747765 [Rhagoletis pomonella]
MSSNSFRNKKQVLIDFEANHNSDAEDDSGIAHDDLIADPSFANESVDESFTVSKISSLLEQFREPAIKIQRLSDLSDHEKEELNASLENIKRNIIKNGSNIEECNSNNQICAYFLTSKRVVRTKFLF